MNEDYSRTFTITNNMLDCHDNLRISSLLDITQETAGDHANLLGVGYEEFKKRNYIWVVFRTKIKIIKNIKCLRSVKCLTSIVKPRLFEFPRDYEIYNNNDLLAQIRSTWAIFDLNENKVCVPNDLTSLFTNNEGIFERVKKMPAFKKEELIYKKDIIVTYSMLDHNGHMNNTRYVDLFLDIFEPSSKEIIQELQVEYVSQCYLNHQISLYIKEIENKKYLYGFEGDTLKFYLEAKYF